jgi:hypothetical protein
MDGLVKQKPAQGRAGKTPLHTLGVMLSHCRHSTIAAALPRSIHWSVSWGAALLNSRWAVGIAPAARRPHLYSGSNLGL